MLISWGRISRLLQRVARLLVGCRVALLLVGNWVCWRWWVVRLLLLLVVMELLLRLGHHETNAWLLVRHDKRWILCDWLLLDVNICRLVKFKSENNDNMEENDLFKGIG